MKNKGFTLIELLAVIVILAIIALIAVPIVLNIIKDSKENATIRSAELYMDAVNLAVANAMMDPSFPQGEVTCEIQTGGNLSCYEGNDSTNPHHPVTVEVKGDIPKANGIITFTNGKVTSVTNFEMPDGSTFEYTNGKLAKSSGSSNNGGSTPTATWTHTDSDEDGVLDVGEIITASNEEEFYVIATPGANDTTVKLLARYNLTSAGTAQDTTGANNPCAFSSTNYWDPNDELSYPLASGQYPDLNDETTYPLGSATSDVKTRLQAYSTSLGATARLMTVEEVVALGGSTSGYSTSSCPTFINSQNFWLGSADHSNGMWVVVGDGSYLSDSSCTSDSVFGVRPVVEISISSIS